MNWKGTFYTWIRTVYLLDIVKALKSWLLDNHSGDFILFDVFIIWILLGSLKVSGWTISFWWIHFWRDCDYQLKCFEERNPVLYPTWLSRNVLFGACLIWAQREECHLLNGQHQVEQPHVFLTELSAGYWRNQTSLHWRIWQDFSTK